MDQIERIETVKQYNAWAGVETLHPLVSVIHFDETPAVKHYRRYMGVYAVFFQNISCGNVAYGCQPYDYENGTLTFVAPEQGDNFDKAIVLQPPGYALIFHPDLLMGTQLENNIREYTFFSYKVREALHLSRKESDAVLECFRKISVEINQNIDKHSKTLIISNIGLLLNYCLRFYDRQFITRTHVNKDIMVRFEAILEDYFKSLKYRLLGLPNVAYCAGKLFLSPDYLNDLIKNETGSTALDLLQTRVIQEAKLQFFEGNKSINEIAYQLGFKYLQHFTQLFKQKTGVTPNEFRHLN